MRITLCGSIAFIDTMRELRDRFEKMGHTVSLPPDSVLDKDGNALPVEEYYRLRQGADIHDEWIWQRKAEAMRGHFQKVADSDAILVVNMTKNGIENYIGPNTFLEMGLAFYFGKKIFLLNPLPKVLYNEELIAMKPVILNGELSGLTL